MTRTVTIDITRHKQAEERLRILAESGRSLDASLDYETTLSNVPGSSCRRWPTIASSFLKNDLGRLELVTSAHSDPRAPRSRGNSFAITRTTKIRSTSADGASHR